MKFNDPDQIEITQEMEEDEEADGLVNDAQPLTLYVFRSVTNAADIIRWAKGQGFKNTIAESDLHVTVAFSRQPVDWFKAGQSWDDEIKLPSGGPRLVEQFGRAIVLRFASSSLSWRHEDFKRIGASWDHDEYAPHITISYDEMPEGKIEPYTGPIVLGPEMFVEVKEDWEPKTNG